MAHPYAHLREQHAGRKRAHAMHGGHFKKGGKVHGDEAQDKKLIKKMLAEHEKGEGEYKVGGAVSKPRADKFARGGKTKHHKGTHINIAVVAPHGKDKDAGAGMPPPGMPPGLPPGMTPKAPMPMPPPPGGPAGGPPGMPPGMPPMKRGGKVFAKGGKVPMTAGAYSGKGRKQKIKAYGLKPIKGKDE